MHSRETFTLYLQIIGLGLVAYTRVREMDTT